MRRIPVILLAVLLAAAGCGPGADGTTSADPSASAPSPAVPSSGAPATPSGSPPSGAPPSSTPAAGTFENPVIDANFADPFVLEVDGTYYAYATGNLTYNIQVATSQDLVTWTRIREALPKLPLWQPSSKGLTWAPEVVAIGDRFVMHYTARDVQAGRQCLAVATAEAPEGPFTDASTGPLACQLDLGGSIDSSPFRDADGTLWLLWKNDGNCCGQHTRFFAQRLTEDGTGLTGEVVDLGLDNDRPWERNVIEAPTLFLHEGTYVLFYSANDYGSTRYAVGYATADQVTGPYADGPANPILTSAGEAAGPGHQSIVADDDGDLWLVYHAWDASRIGDSIGGRRALWIDPLVFEDGVPVIAGPNGEPQAVP